jgi:hypothetical protein
MVLSTATEQVAVGLPRDQQTVLISLLGVLTGYFDTFAMNMAPLGNVPVLMLCKKCF